MRLRQIEIAAAVAQVAQFNRNTALGEVTQHLIKAHELELGEGFVGFIGLREMAEDALERERLGAANQFNKRQSVVPPDAVTVHPRVDFQMYRNALARAGGKPAKFLDRLGFTDAASQIVREAPRQFVFMAVAE